MNSPTVTSAGLTAGSSTRQNAPKDPQPSISAASSSSRGIVLKALRIMKMPNGTWNRVSTNATPTSESCSPICFIQTSSGISRAAYGTIMTDSTIANSVLRPTKRKRANAYPPVEQTTSATAVATTDRISVLRRYSGSPAPYSNSVT